MKFSKELEQKFVEAGKGKIENSNLVKLLKQYNYPQFAIDFMKEYGGVEVSSYHPNANKINFKLEEPRLDLVYAMSEDSEMSVYRDALGKKLYYLGEHTPHAWFICCDENGHIYQIADDCYYCGNNIYKGIENIMINDKEDNLIYGFVEKQWFKIRYSDLTYHPTNFDNWVLKH